MTSISKYSLVCIIALLIGCGGGSSSMEEVSFNGTVSEVKTGDQILTVQVPDSVASEGSVDLAFTDTTQIVNMSFAVQPFDSLAVDQEVRVKAQKGKDKHVPIQVTILK
jgi:hypothetical protein